MKAAGWNEKTYRENVRRNLAINKLVDKITSRIDAPKDSEIEAFYNGNKEAFVKKRGAKLGARVEQTGGEALVRIVQSRRAACGRGDRRDSEAGAERHEAGEQ